jgi:hypothetical protein
MTGVPGEAATQRFSRRAALREAQRVTQSGRRWDEGFWTRPPPAASGGATLRVGLGVPVALAACRDAIDGVGNLTYTKVQACDTKLFELYLYSLPLVAAKATPTRYPSN